MCRQWRGRTRSSNSVRCAHCAPLAARRAPRAQPSADKVVQAKRKEYADPDSRRNLARVNEELHDIQSIMRSSIEQVLDRGQKLEGARAHVPPGARCPAR